MNADILSDVVQKKATADQTIQRIAEAKEKLSSEHLALQQSRWKFHEIVGPYPLKFRMKGPFSEMFRTTDVIAWGMTFTLGCFMGWLLSFTVGAFGFILTVIVSLWIFSEMRQRYAWFTKWAKSE